MRRALALFVLGAFAALAVPAAVTEPYVGVSGVMLLPQGGSDARRIGGAQTRFGAYLGDYLAVEGAVGALEYASALAAQSLVHFSQWTFYSKYFGFSAFDPFLTLGVQGWIGRDGQVGPKLGTGTFYHFTDSLSLRLDADATLGLDADVEVVYTISAGVQYAF